jgi:hypothetical protein
MNMGLRKTSAEREDDLNWLNENQKRICALYEEGFSILELQNLRGGQPLSRKHIEQLLVNNGISLRGFKRTKRYSEKVAATSLKKFGFANASSSPEIKKKRSDTFLKKYGVENPFQAEEVKAKIAQTNIHRYGHQNYGCLVQRGRTSNVHKILSSGLAIAGIPHENEVMVSYGKQSFFVDIVLGGGTCAVEVYGDYYHANPNKYHPDDLISVYEGKLAAKDIWTRDQDRLAKIQITLPVMVIWEHDIKHNLQQVVLNIKEYYESHQHRLANCI